MSPAINKRFSFITKVRFNCFTEYSVIKEILNFQIAKVVYFCFSPTINAKISWLFVAIQTSWSTCFIIGAFHFSPEHNCFP